MKKNLYSVFDSKAQSFCNPFSSETDQTALRDFSFVANDPSSAIGRNPEDFTLFRVCTFNFNDGSIVSETTPQSIAVAFSLLRGL